MLEMLMSDWEDLLEDEEYEPVHDALRAGITLLEKYYRRADDTDAYFISHGDDADRPLSVKHTHTNRSEVTDGWGCKEVRV